MALAMHSPAAEKTPSVRAAIVLNTTPPTRPPVYINRPLDLTFPAEQTSRVERLKTACAKETEGDTMNILMHEDRKSSLRTSYCVVPKAGCTFWIRVFRFLNNDTAGTHPRYEVDWKSCVRPILKF